MNRCINYINADKLREAIRHLSCGETDAMRLSMKIIHYMNNMMSVNFNDDTINRDEQIEYWRNKAKSYERTILKLCEALGGQDDD